MKWEGIRVRRGGGSYMMLNRGVREGGRRVVRMGRAEVGEWGW